MNITINNTTVEILPGETLIEAARRTGHSIPSLCYAKEAKHKSSCMVCAVKNVASGQIIPSCTTLPTEGMAIETESDDIKLVRRLSLELLLSDHRADCDAPCAMVCPYGLDIELMLTYYDTQKYEEAQKLISETFDLPTLGCDTCKAPCEKICRRKSVDEAVSIRAIIAELSKTTEATLMPANKETIVRKADKDTFQSLLGRFTDKEKEYLQHNTTNVSRCLHCACSGKTNCKLRIYATAEKIKRPRYESGSALPVMRKVHVKENIWFEQAKCIRCGLCVYNSNNGFTFMDRGFGMQVVLPEENKVNINNNLVALCPTGALYINDR